jgi:hypothetical protein
MARDYSQAQKLLEPSKLDRLIISPERVELGPYEQAQFTAKGIDQYGHPFTVEGCSWSAPDCTVAEPGRVQVGETPGVFSVLARCGDIESQAQIRVTAAISRVGPAGNDRDQDGHEDAEKVKVICWNGAIPPQKWTTFYMKVVSPFAAVPGLSLRVRSRCRRTTTTSKRNHR